MQSDRDKTADDIKRTLNGRRCWYASCGGSYVGATFELALGRKIPRDHIVQNDAHSDVFRRFEGEANLLVWCTWRLDGKDAPISSSDDTEQGIIVGLQRLVGEKIVSAQVEMPGWDLILRFSTQFTLRIFCDHVPGDPSVDGNWQVSLEDKIIAIGPGAACDIEPRAERRGHH
jgi:hypothetical protein